MIVHTNTSYILKWELGKTATTITEDLFCLDVTTDGVTTSRRHDEITFTLVPPTETAIGSISIDITDTNTAKHTNVFELYISTATAADGSVTKVLVGRVPVTHVPHTTEIVRSTNTNKVIIDGTLY